MGKGKKRRREKGKKLKGKKWEDGNRGEKENEDNSPADRVGPCNPHSRTAYPQLVFRSIPNKPRQDGLRPGSRHKSGSTNTRTKKKKKKSKSNLIHGCNIYNPPPS